jgi:hypothetical protein
MAVAGVDAGAAEAVCQLVTANVPTTAATTSGTIALRLPNQLLRIRFASPALPDLVTVIAAVQSEPPRA